MKYIFFLIALLPFDLQSQQPYCFDSTEIKEIYTMQVQRDSLVSFVYKIDSLHYQIIQKYNEATVSYEADLKMSNAKINNLDGLLKAEVAHGAVTKSKYEKIINDKEKEIVEKEKKAKRKLLFWQIGEAAVAALIIGLIL